jgi:hypothetical protein
MEIESQAPKAGEIRMGKGSGTKVRNPRGLLKSLPAPKIEQMQLFG